MSIKTPQEPANGFSWADAFLNLQDALEEAGSNDEVWVASGNYRPDLGENATLGDRNATFTMKNGLDLYGGFNGTEAHIDQRNPAINVTTLSGDLLENDGPNFLNYEDNSYHVVTIPGNVSRCILDGFTVSSGSGKQE